MQFVIIGWDGPNGQAKRPQHRPAHLERLQALDNQGKLIYAGPFTDNAGSLIIIEANSIEEAEAFVQEDPYVKEGIFDRMEVHPFKQVFPKENAS